MWMSDLTHLHYLVIYYNGSDKHQDGSEQNSQTSQNQKHDRYCSFRHGHPYFKLFTNKIYTINIFLKNQCTKLKLLNPQQEKKLSVK